MNIDEENVKLNLFEKLSVLSTDMEDLLSNITSRSQGEIRFQIKAAKDESTMHNSPEIDYVLTLFCLLNDEITENYINKGSKVIGTSVRPEKLTQIGHYSKWEYDTPTSPIQYSNMFKRRIYWLRSVQLLLLAICVALIQKSLFASVPSLHSDQLHVRLYL